MQGTSEVVRVLQGEGFRLSKTRLDSLVASGRIASPRLVGTSRGWSDTDVQGVRAALVRLDGPPRAARAVLIEFVRGGDAQAS